MTNDHFQGKKAFEHLIDARLKGKIASSEIHGVELAGHYSAGADAAKETTFLFLVLLIVLQKIGVSNSLLHPAIFSLFFGFLFWKTGRSALLGYTRLNRLHRLIEEERYEIEHHRPQEKEELKALYEAKGIKGKLLDDLIDHLMADDDRLLQVMLEEELGLRIESFEHPLKQALGAFLGVLGTLTILSLSDLLLPHLATCFIGFCIIATSSITVAHFEKNRALPSLIWNLGVFILAILIPYLLLSQ